MLVREGDSVSASQVLAELDDSQIRAKVAQAEASVAALQAQLKVAEQQGAAGGGLGAPARERAAAASTRPRATPNALTPCWSAARWIAAAASKSPARHRRRHPAHPGRTASARSRT